MRGFSNSLSPHTYSHLSFDSSLPMPFKIPRVLQILIDPKTDLSYTLKQNDLLEALRFSLSAKTKMFAKVGEKENALVQEMTQENEEKTQRLKDEYNELQTQKMEASEICFDLINAISEELSASQYQKLMKLSGFSL
jgi:predicted nuclease with TOPRIM domain